MFESNDFQPVGLVCVRSPAVGDVILLRGDCYNF